MYNEMIRELEKKLDKNIFENIKRQRLHLAVCIEPYLTYMLDGKKTIESRIYQKRLAPYNKISKDDIVVIKKSGGSIVGLIIIKDILEFELSDKNAVYDLKLKYNNEIMADDIFWKAKENCHFATLIKIDKIIRLNPFHINKKGMQSWIVLGD